MNRNLTLGAIAAAALLAPLAAHAQSATDAVTIYGVADAYLQYGKGDRSGLKIESGGLSGSRLGFKGSRDLGNGLTALFQFEAGLAVDRGVSTQGGRLFGRQALVGLTGSFGSVTVGRQYTPHFLAVDGSDAFETGAGSAANSGVLSFLSVRADNSVVYVAPKLGNVTVTGLFASGESTSGSTTNGNIYAADVRYASGPLEAGVTVLEAARTADGAPNQYVALASGTYDLGTFKVFGGVQEVKHLAIGSATADRTEYFLGAHVPVGKDTVWGGFYGAKAKSLKGGDATQFSLGYVHPMGKGLDSYVVASAIHNGSLTSYTTDSATGSGPSLTELGKSAQSVQVGLRYRF